MVLFRKLKLQDEDKLKMLFEQLTKNKVFFNARECIKDANLHCLVIEEDGGAVIGFGALVIYRTPTKGKLGKIEDIVIDERRRGLGFARDLVMRLLDIAKENGIHRVDLTSNPSRVKARRLYEMLGFELRDTGVFQMTLQ